MISRPSTVVPQPPKKHLSKNNYAGHCRGAVFRGDRGCRQNVTLATAVTTSPTLQFSRSKRARTTSISTEDEDERKLGRAPCSPSGEKSHTFKRRDWDREKSQSGPQGTLKNKRSSDQENYSNNSRRPMGIITSRLVFAAFSVIKQGVGY